jgi:hypothetical protein
MASARRPSPITGRRPAAEPRASTPLSPFASATTSRPRTGGRGGSEAGGRVMIAAVAIHPRPHTAVPVLPSWDHRTVVGSVSRPAPQPPDTHPWAAISLASPTEWGSTSSYRSWSLVTCQRIADHTCSERTLRRRRDEWIAAGIAERHHQPALAAHDRLLGLGLAHLARRSPGRGAPRRPVRGSRPTARRRGGSARARYGTGNGSRKVKAPGEGPTRPSSASRCLASSTLGRWPRGTHHSARWASPSRRNHSRRRRRKSR